MSDRKDNELDVAKTNIWNINISFSQAFLYDESGQVQL